MRTCWARLGLSLKKANPIRTSHFSWRMRGYASSDDDMSGHDDDDSDFDDDARDEEASFGNESARSLKVVRKDVQVSTCFVSAPPPVSVFHSIS